MPHRLPLAAAALFLLLASPLPAQEPDPVEELAPVVVTGRQIEEKLSAELADFGHQVQVIRGEVIEKMGFVDLNDALPILAPGLYIMNKGRGDYARYTLSGNSDVLWLMDGVRLNNRLYGSAYMDTIGVNMIDRVEILYGGEGLFYGTDATSGVVNIITKKPPETLSGAFGLTYGSGDMAGVKGHVGDSLGANRFLIFGSYEDWGGYRPFREDVYLAAGNPDRRDRSYDRANLGLKLARDFGENADRRLNVHAQRNSGAFDFAYPNFRSALNDREEYILTAKWDHDVTDNFSYYLKTYYHNWWTDYTRINLNGSYASNAAVWGYQDWGLNLLGSYRLDRGDEILVGLDYQNYWGKDEVLLIAPRHESVTALFAQYRPYFSFWPDWKVALGLRYNYLDQGGGTTVWNISSRMPFLEDRLWLRANVGTSFKLPTAEQLFAVDPWETGNPDLKPVRSFSANVGLGARWDFLELEASVFHENITDRIVLDAANVFQNVGEETRIRGYTLSGEIKPRADLSLTASYTWQEAKTGGFLAKRNGIPDDFASLGLRWNGRIAETPVGLGLFGRYVGRVHTGYAALALAGAPQEYGRYWLADANVYAEITEHSRVSLALANLFDRETESQFSRFNTAGGPYYYGPLINPFSATLTYSYNF